MNSIIISGRFTKDHELKKSGKGTAYVQNVLAVQRTKEEADFIPVLITGKAAEFLATASKKGMRAIVSGRLQVSSYDKDGKKNYSYTVMADNVECVDMVKKESKDESTPDMPFEF